MSAWLKQAAVMTAGVSLFGTCWAATYYVNDASTNGDVYCTAVGSDTNNGNTAATPMLSLTNLLVVKDLNAGDTVLIDTGGYSNYTVFVSSNDAGSVGTYVTFQGSTNFAAGGSSFVITNAALDQNVFYVYEAPFVAVSNLTFVGGGEGNAAGIQVRYSPNCRVVGCVARGTTVGSHGFYFRDGSPNGELIQCVSVGHGYRAAKVSGSTNVSIQNCVFWGGGPVGFENTSPKGSISNSVLNSSSGEVLYRSDSVFSDYNVYYPAAGGFIANDGVQYYANLSEYQQAYTQELHSSVFDPQFASTTNFDFHPLSTTGRYVRGVGWTNDSVTSGLIDMGYPKAAYANEPAPNGSRINVGNFGNTIEASKSPTNARLRALMFNDGGTVSGTGNLYWVAVNFGAADKVRVECSPDGGSTWAIVQTNIPATNEVGQWNTTTNASSARSKWRVVYEANTNIFDEADRVFSVHNTNLFFYVNDAVTNGDVYTSAEGSSNNTGVSASSPKRNLQEITDSYDLNGGDTVYIDTGSYVLTNITVTVGLEDSGSSTSYVLIQGSTNQLAGGSVLEHVGGAASQYAVTLSRVSRLRLADLTIKGGTVGGAALYFWNSPYNECVRVTCQNSSGYGFFFDAASHGSRMLNCVSAQNSDYAVRVNVATNVEVLSSVLWGNRGVWAGSAGSVGVTNSIIRASGSGNYAMRSDASQIQPDYDLVVMSNSAAVGCWDGVTYYTLSSYQENRNGGWHCLAADPLFADPAGTNFHLLSQMGRWTESGWTNDPVTSPAIDLGDPSSVYTNEPSPNGSRINAGLYGNTSQASKSRTNAWLQALSYNDGGTLDAPGDVVYWNSGNLPGGARVRIELSRDAGSTWYVIDTNILATVGSSGYTWNNTNYLSSRFARWRVVYEASTNVFGATSLTNFTFRNGRFTYYVNDGSQAGDVYCSTVGNDANLGTDAGAPKATLKSVFQYHDVQPDDTIYVDTGFYVWFGSQPFGVLESGSTNYFVTVQGSTNFAAGGTMLDGRYAGGAVLDLSAAQYVDLRDLTITNSSLAVQLSAASGSRLTHLVLKGNGEGVRVLNSGDVGFERCVIMGNSSNGVLASNSRVSVDRCVLWGNVGAGLRVAGGQTTVSNSVVVALGSGAYGYYASGPTNISGDYNDIFAQSNAVVGGIATLGRNMDTLDAWIGETTSEVHSLSVDPLFFDPDGLDFHLKTEASQGRYLPGVGWVRDVETSWLIDSGSPAADYSSEPEFNGRRINIGLDGNTAEASKGLADARLHAASLRQGGWVRGTGTLHWVAGGAATSHTVRIEYSPDGGQSWSILTNSVAASAELFAWDTTRTNNTPAGLWRVTSVTDPTVTDQTTNFFAVRNGNLSIYVNDPGTAGDVYTVGPGASTNWVASTNRPIDSLATALARYDVEPGDTVFVDTGSFTSTVNTVISRLDGGSSNAVVRILGSTNESAGGSVLDRGSQVLGAYGMEFNSVQWVAVSNLTVRGAYTGVRLDHAGQLNLGRSRFINNYSNGIHAVSSDNLTFERVVSAGNGGRGLFSRESYGLRLLQSVVWSNTEGALQAIVGGLEVSNSVLGVTGLGRYVYELVSNATVRADYNDVLTESQGYVSRQGSTVAKNLIRWQQGTSNDLHSLSHTPLFADPAALDYHPRSRAGRFSWAVTNFVTTDTNTSYLVDTGDPAADYSLEPAPHGGRLNIGPHGNDVQASKSETNGWLLVLTLNDGGNVRGTNDLCWVAGGVATGHLVYVDFYDGLAWTNIATNLQASAGMVTWTSTLFRSTAQGRWRVVSQSTPSVFDQTDSLFALNNDPLSYYVNDSSTNGDVYATATGSLTNDGLSQDSPLPSIEAVLAAYDLTPGDRILVDTGTYVSTNTLSVANFSGSIMNPLTIRGSTNGAAGGTVLDFQGNSLGFVIRESAGVEVDHLKVVGARKGIRLYSATNCVLQWLTVEGGDTAYEVELSPGTRLSHCVASGASTNGLLNVSSSNTVWQNGVLWNNGWSNGAGVRLTRSLYAVDPPAGDVSVSNSVIVVLSSNAYAYSLDIGAVRSDFNDIFLTNGACAALQAGSPFSSVRDTVSRWARDSGNDRHSLSSDPLFHNAATGDFHPKSQAGRYDATNGGFVVDAETSPLIDAGDPGSAPTNEPPPDGARLNIGLYGNTPEASKTPTNASFSVITLNDGGRIEGANYLYWVARGDATGHLARLRFSADGGITWTNIATGLQASASAYPWDTTLYSNTLTGFWQILSENDPNIQDRTDFAFALRNAPFLLYVNDASTNGNVYTFTEGRSTNAGVSPWAPKDSIQGVLDAWDLEPGDTVYVDTGVYSNTVLIRQLDGGPVGGSTRVVIKGSTNYASGGTILVSTNNVPIRVLQAAGIELRNLEVRGSSIGLHIEKAEGCAVEWFNAVGGQVGFFVEGAQNTRFTHCLARQAGQYGLHNATSSNTVWTSGVLWSNAIGAYQGISTNYSGDERNTLAFSNSVVCVFGTNGAAYYVQAGAFGADYNDLYVASGAYVARLPDTNGPVLRIYDSVSRLGRDAGVDQHSLSYEPGFADPARGDFHLKSQGGRYVVSNGLFVLDGETSVLIDAGHPLAVYTNEPSPNGGRLNIGLYGNSAEASKTPTNAILAILSLNDGGRAEGANWVLNWLALGAVTAHTVRLDFSSDAGETWQAIATNVAGTNTAYVWNTTLFTSSPRGVWKITSELDTNVYDQSDRFFALRNSAFTFYVNDGNTNGDVYTQGEGRSTNLGLVASAPCDTLEGVLDLWDLESGDRVYVDTGQYSNSSPIYIGQLDGAGRSNAVRVVIQGSTNATWGGTVFDRRDAANGVELDAVGGVELRNLNIRRAQVGVQVAESEGGVFEWVCVDGGNAGFLLSESERLGLRHCSVRGASGAGVQGSDVTLVEWQSGVLWSNRYGVYLDGESVVTVSNSVIGVCGFNSYAFYLSLAQIGSDYNDIFLTNGAAAACRNVAPKPEIFHTVSRWARDTAQDRHSLSVDPKFFDVAAGDFHLRSQGGRYQPTSGVFVADGETSELIDSGSPVASFVSEPSPNGARLNIGLYGNTAEESKTPTNGSLTAISLNDGGRVEGVWPLYWLARGAATGHTVRLEFSGDGGVASWQNIVTGLQATLGLYVWDTRSHTSTVLGVWRVVSENNTNIYDRTDRLFAVRNSPLHFYVNDAGTNNDMYCTAAGSPANGGVSPAVPAIAIQDVLNTWDLEPGDTIYVDTGNYLLTESVTIDRFDAWDQTTNFAALAAGLATNRVTVRGSTNEAAGGSVLTRVGGGLMFNLNSAAGVAFRNLRIRNATTGVGAYDGSHYMQAEWVRCENGNVGFDVDHSNYGEMRHCAALGNLDKGLSSVWSDGTIWQYGVLWSNRWGAYQQRGSLTVENSVLGSFGEGSFAHFHVWGTKVSDYNDMYLRDGGFAGAVMLSGDLTGNTTRYESVFFWSQGVGKDLHTLSTEPGFANVGAGDLHLRTVAPAGRYNAVLGVWTNDGDTSHLIDAGNPSSAFTNEPLPNGSRADIGMYGNTPQASRTPTNGWFTVITLNDGGSVREPITLRWVVGGAATGHLVHVDFSPVGGLTWTNIATNVAAADGEVFWDNSTYGRSAAGLWRVVSCSDTSAYDVSDQYFIMPTNNSGSIPYFVNDNSTNGDVYCSAAGSAANQGIVPYAPANSVQAVIDAFKLEPGDIVYVDTGEYLLTADIIIGDLDSGSATNHVTIQGSTNYGAGGTILNRQVVGGGTRGIYLQTASGIELKDLTVRNAYLGVQMNLSHDCFLSRIRSENNGQTGFGLQQSGNISFDHCVAFENGGTSGTGVTSDRSDLTWENGVIWGNASAVSLVQSGTNRYWNSVLQVSGNGRRIFKSNIDTPANAVVSDYNNLIHEDTAMIAEQDKTVGGSDLYRYLVDWQRGRGQDLHSLSHEPQFVDRLNGDFHARSRTGRYLDDGTLTNDLVTSPLVDAGDPASAYTNEQAPNGGRVNIGRYGGSSRASLSETNPWVLAVSFNDGGIVLGTNTIRWVAGAMTNGALVRMEYTPNNGIDWYLIASNVLASATGHTWDVSGLPIGALYKWRLLSEGAGSVTDTLDNVFTIKNNALTVYINDSSTSGDCYCAAVGSPFNTGLSPASPLDSPLTAMQKYILSAGDTLKIDTGVYYLTNTFSISEVRGLSNLPIQVIGSTNAAFGGTILWRSSPTEPVFQIDRSTFVEASYLRLTDGGVGLNLSDVSGCRFNWIEVYGNMNAGFALSSADLSSFEHCAAWSNQWGLTMGGLSIASWRNGVIWGNRSAGLQLNQGAFDFYNSILHSVASNSYLYEIWGVSLVADYNFLWREGPAALARHTLMGINYVNLEEWIQNQGVDQHSVAANDPLFADPPGGDFHLRSQAGRYAGGTWTNDADTSWAIDAGNPTNAYGNEPAPNGARLNVGLYGDTSEASLSVTGASGRALLAVSLNDGGLIQGSKTLYWLSRGLTAADKVSLEFSDDNGVTWTNIATNLSATANGYVWDLGLLPSSPLGRWKVAYEADPNVADTNDAPFVLRNGPITFYVNDDSTNDDIYTTAVGSPTNTGLLPDSPKRLIQQVLAYDLEGGDRVLVDTGYYSSPNEVYVSQLDSGMSTSPVYFIGTTNPVGGGTVLHAEFTDPSQRAVVHLKSATWVSLSHLILENGQQGLYFDLNASQNTASNLVIRDCVSAGIEAYQSQGNRISQTVITRIGSHGFVGRDASGASTMERCVVWESGGSAVSLLLATLNVSNSVLSASGLNNYCYLVSTGASVRANYNGLFITNGAVYGLVGSVPLERLPQWTAATTCDVHSVTADPLFYDPGNEDFHLQSQMGRFDPSVRAFVTNDASTSPLIDAGSPGASWTNEPEPNGDRINIGLHGDTAEASQSPTNRWIIALTATDGGRLEGIFYLAWNAGNVDPTNTVTLDYSFDDGSTWTNVARSVSITYWSYLWDSAEKYDGTIERYPSSPIARWRIVMESDTNLYDVTDSRFALRNRLFVYYVNDDSTNGDVYCTAVGSCTNLGFFAWSPKGTLKCALDDADIEGEDIVLLDTGTYPVSTNDLAVLGLADQGKVGFPVIIRGNTNALLTVLQRITAEPLPILTVNGGYVDIGHMMFLGGGLSAVGANLAVRNMVFTNGNVSLTGPSETAEDLRLDGGAVSVSGGGNALRRITAKNGAFSLTGTNIVLENSLIYGNADPAVSLNGASIVLRNNTLVGSGTQVRQSGFGGSTLQNNIIVADGADKFCILRVGGTLVSDYNDLVARGGAWIGNANGNWERLFYWQRESAQDLHSLSAEPLFANEAGEDHHLRSVVGRRVPSGWTNDASHSPCIDAGDPSIVLTNEPAPNGGRVNLGAYGNTDEASMSRTNAWLFAVTMNDGGVLKGTNTIRWVSGNLGASDVVSLQYSPDNGSTWTTLANSVSATAGEYPWDTTQVTSSLTALWRIMLQTNATVVDTNDQLFAVRNVPLDFYVNDASTVSDAFCSAVGASGNDGLSAGAPKDSVQGILDAYDTEAQDTIWVDTGTYPLSADIRIIWSRGGDNQYGNLMIRGSTNFGAAPTILSRDSTAEGSDCFDVKASRVTLRDFTLRNAYRGVYFQTNRYCVAERITAVSNVFGVVNCGTINATNRNLSLLYNRLGGVDVVDARTTVVENCVFVGNSNFGCRVLNSVNNVLQNSIYWLSVSNSTALAGDSNVLHYLTFVDYNIYYFAASSSIYGTHRDLMNWQLSELHDYRSAITNPLFASVPAGDFHLRSTAGRYSNGTWVADASSSWAIDKGNPSSDWTLEPETNGERINIGAYGGTEFASKGSTNATVYVRTLNDATHIGETNSTWPLIWTVINVPQDETFKVQYSGDGGASWVNLATGVNAYTEYVIWNTEKYYNTYKGRWRVVGESETNYWDRSDSLFDIFYGEFAISQGYLSEGMHSIIWRGAWDEVYQVQYTTNIAATNGLVWWNAANALGLNHQANFLSTRGGDFLYEDIASSNSPWRLYRVRWEPH